MTIDGVRAPNSNALTITSNGTAVGNPAAAAAAQQHIQMVPHTLTHLQVSLCVHFHDMSVDGVRWCLIDIGVLDT